MAAASIAERAAALERPEATGHVRLHVARDARGRARLARPAGAPASARERPVELALDFGLADGGARPYTPRDRHVHRLAVEMRQAPASGYAPLLPLDPESTRRQYFFVKLGDRYGRGSVTPAVVARTSAGRRIEVHVTLLVNPDGTRNLEADRSGAPDSGLARGGSAPPPGPRDPGGGRTGRES